MGLFFFYLEVNKDIDTAFYMLPTRIWELSIGGLSGLIKFQKSHKLHSKTGQFTTLLPIVGICFIVFSYLIGSKDLWIFPVVGSSLVILFCTQDDIIGKILSMKAFVFIGKISYSLYLWHWGIIVLFKNLQYQFQYVNQHLINGFIVFLTFLLSYLTYNFVENKTRNYQPTPKIVLAGIGLVVGLTLYFQSDFYNPYYNSKYNKQTYYSSYYDISPTPIIPNANNPINHNVIRPLRLPEFNDAYKKEGIITSKSLA